MNGNLYRSVGSPVFNIPAAPISYPNVANAFILYSLYNTLVHVQTYFNAFNPYALGGKKLENLLFNILLIIYCVVPWRLRSKTFLY